MSNDCRRLATLLGSTLAMCVLAAPAQASGWRHHHRNPGLEPGNLVIAEASMNRRISSPA